MLIFGLLLIGFKKLLGKNWLQCDIHIQCNCSIPCSTDELFHNELQQLLWSTEEAVGIQELVNVPFHGNISAIKSVELKLEKKIKIKFTP